MDALIRWLARWMSKRSKCSRESGADPFLWPAVAHALASACSISAMISSTCSIHRDPRQVLRDAGACQLFAIELAMRSRGGVAREGLCAVDIDQAQDQVQRVDEPAAGLLAAL